MTSWSAPGLVPEDMEEAMEHREGQQHPHPPAAAGLTAQSSRAQASSSIGEVSTVHAKHEHAREGAGVVVLPDAAAEQRAPSMAPTVGGLPPAHALIPAPQGVAVRSSLGEAACLGRHAEGSMQQPASFPVPSFGAKPACTGNTTEQDPGSQFGRTAELCAAAQGAAAGSWTAAPTIGLAAITSAILAKDVVSEGVIDILTQYFSSSAHQCLVTFCVAALHAVLC